MLNLVLFGPPGAGKGTQSEKLLEKYGLIHLSTGDILRGEMKAETELGLKAKSLIEAGNLVPDEVVIGMIDNKISDTYMMNDYAITKWAGELMCINSASMFNSEIVRVSLGKRILRAETAAVSALTSWHSISGDWAK